MQIITGNIKKNTLKFQTQQWFLKTFAVAGIMFAVLLVPSLVYTGRVFRKLELEKYNQRVQNGADMIGKSIDQTLYVAQTLSNNKVFRSLKYKNFDYSQVSYEDKVFMKNYMSNLLQSDELASHVVLMLEKDVAISQNQIFFQNGYDYYPTSFCVNDYSFEEWQQVLSDNQNGFLPISKITHYGKSYEGLIYCIKWGSNGHMYMCFDTKDIQKLFVSDEESGECYLCIRTSQDDSVLYKNLPDDGFSGEILTSHVSSGDIEIDLYVGANVLDEKMKPLIWWILLYVAVCSLAIILVGVGGAYFVMYPLRSLLEILERYRHDESEIDYRQSVESVSNHILAVETDLQNYKELVWVQQERLRIRYLEKALNGQVFSLEDKMIFRSCFPDFPEEGYYVFRLRLWSADEKKDILYSEGIQLLNLFIEQNFPCFYLKEKLSDTELILITKTEDFESCCKHLEFIVSNVNREEPYYEVRCYVSKEYRYLENLSLAYAQVCNMEDFTFSEEKTRVCMPEEGFETKIAQTIVTRMMTFYTAVSCGNKEMALEWLHNYSEELLIMKKMVTNKCVYQMICSVLNCIKLEHMQLLLNQDVPRVSSYKKMEEGESIESVFGGVVSSFCDKINSGQQKVSNNFAKDLVDYVDEHYADCDICIDSLADYFERSPSTIRKTFKSVENITVAAYVEQKRMKLANELLQQNRAVAEVSQKCGYVNENSFYKAYRRFYGYAPSKHIGNTKEG